MRDVDIARLAGTQFNRVSRRQLYELGLDELAVDRRIKSGRLVATEEAVFAVPPLLDDDRGRWAGAILTQPGTILSHISALAAFALWSPRRPFETVTRHGNGGPRRHGGLLVYRSVTLEGDCTTWNGIPITTASRTLLDTARIIGPASLARALRDAVRLERTSIVEVGDILGKHRGRRGARKLALAVSRYSGLPLERARSGAEIRAMQLLRDSGRPLPQLNFKIAGEEADLSWPAMRLIVEIDGGPYHLDVGEDARKEAAWKSVGWEVRRLPADDIYERPEHLLALAPR